MLAEPTLMFYIDVPPRYASLICLNLAQLLKFDSHLMGVAHWIFAGLVPCNARVLAKAAALIVRKDASLQSEGKRTSFTF